MISAAELRERYQYHFERGNFAETLYMYQWLRRRGALAAGMLDPRDALERAEAIPFHIENGNIGKAVEDARWVRGHWPGWRREELDRGLADLEARYQALNGAMAALKDGRYDWVLDRVQELKKRGWTGAEVLRLEGEATVRAQLQKIEALLSTIHEARNPIEQFRLAETLIKEVDRTKLSSVAGASDSFEDLQGRFAAREKAWLEQTIAGLLREGRIEEASPLVRAGADKYRDESVFAQLAERLSQKNIKQFRAGLLEAEKAERQANLSVALDHLMRANTLFPESEHGKKQLEALWSKITQARELTSKLVGLDLEYEQAGSSREYRKGLQAARQALRELSAPNIAALMPQEEIAARRRSNQQRAKESLRQLLLSYITGEALMRRLLPAAGRRSLALLWVPLLFLFGAVVWMSLSHPCPPYSDCPTPTVDRTQRASQVAATKVAQDTVTAESQVTRTVPSPTTNTRTNTATSIPPTATRTGATATLVPPTATSIPATVTRTPSPRPTATPRCVSVVDSQTDRLNVREGPGTEYAAFAWLNDRDEVTILCRNQEMTWLKTRLTNGSEGWVIAEFVKTCPSMSSYAVCATPTPRPITNPNFRADRTTITRGECTVLRWDVDGIRAVYLDQTGQSGHGSYEVCPSQTQTFTLRVVAQSGQEASYRLTITVNVSTERVFVAQYKGCQWGIPSNIGQVKGEIRDRYGNLVVGAAIKVSVNGTYPSGYEQPKLSDEAGWYGWNFTPGQRIRFESLVVGGQPVRIEPAGYAVDSQAGCFQRVDFQER
jgi:hypothetical protein